MSRVGLITMHKVVNCGSQLQTYALARIIDSLGNKCCVINYRYPDLYHYAQKMNGCEGGAVKRLLKNVAAKVGMLHFAQWMNLRLFELRNRHKMRVGWLGIDLTKEYTISSIHKNPPQFAIYVVGSDQVWNPHCIVGDYTYLLDFVPDGKRKIAYSASFGVKNLPVSERKLYARLLARFDAIGTRESSGVEILNSLGIKGGVAVLDPTMLLGRLRWEEYATNRRLYNGRYLFCYILSYVFKSSPWIIKYTKDVAASLGCDVVFYGGGEQDCVPDAELGGFRVLKDYITPQDMVRYYLDAEYVIANGFHGTAFAITLDKQCTIVTNPNPSDDDRVMSLLERTGYGSRAVKCGVADYNVSRGWLLDNRPARDCFERLRDKSIEFLKCALSGVKYPGTFGKDCD